MSALRIGGLPGVNKITYRVRQVLQQIDRNADPEADSALQELLSGEEWRLLARLSPADRRHALAVHRELVRHGWTDADLLKAALLHDVGKADGSVRPATVHRIIKVLVARVSPRMLDHSTLADGNWLRHGLYLSVHHAALGARLVREIGLPDRVCWLIEHHDDGTISGDPALVALRTIDAEA